MEIFAYFFSSEKASNIFSSHIEEILEFAWLRDSFLEVNFKMLTKQDQYLLFLSVAIF